MAERRRARTRISGANRQRSTPSISEVYFQVGVPLTRSRPMVNLCQTVSAGMRAHWIYSLHDDHNYPNGKRPVSSETIEKDLAGV